MTTYGHGIIGYILTLISLMNSVLACTVAFIVLVRIIYHHYQYRQQLKREEKMTLMLSGHIYLFIFLNTVTFISMNTQTLIGDVYENDFDSPWCVFRTYAALLTGFVMYHTFVIQGLYRLCRIVYWNYRWLQSYRILIISSPVTIVGGCILLCPLLVWHDIIYLSKEYYCYILSSNIRATLWIVAVCFTMPLACMLTIYARIILYLRQQSNNLAVMIKQRHQRDLMIIRRIFLSAGILSGLGFPGLVVVLISFTHGVEYPLGHRITLAGIEISLALLTLQTVTMTPQLRRLVLGRWQRNRVIPFEGVLQMRPMASDRCN